MKEIRWGIVGPGGIARKFAKAIKNVEGATLYAVASRSEEKGKKFAQEFDIPKVFCGYEEMAASCEVDAVYIATPHPFHKPCAEFFLNAKKHVLCEKPMCINAYQAEKLKEIAKANDVFLMEAMWTRFLPAVNEAKRIAQSGEIGEIRGISADFCYSIQYEEDPKIYEKDMAGGSLLDVGVYCLHFAKHIMGEEPETIISQSYNIDGVDGHIAMMLKYKNGAIATLSSAIAARKPASGYIYGSQGYIYLPNFYGANELYVSSGLEDRNDRHISKPALGEGFEEEIYEACNCIRNGKTESDVVSLDETIGILRQMDYIRKENSISYPFEGE